ncbi:MAG: D-sedoheptulose 7-phosphate isomerase [Bacteroidales bacterium]|nr:D-sedoheptulose 7-phosphate isomerase [Bacteroidales bacterium]MDD2324172.1 D-sedoheptulose 7-phosphate isomerase [Bacteroidales bacterium]MDD3011040.1 D-sedoheptulose 7-phosphate isomerase [Bacteroidales bacterium]MDD3961830.1 D-sedoheptulose 7-phosphate isomerase [Bacteroidales bacterium]MDY0286227.1 D-sedoheptulose 7-phosphate isomerase [Bacteroidales bacterium]
MNKIQQAIAESLELKKALLADEALIERMNEVSESLITALRNDRKVLFCGNGGSAADAQHLAAELSGRFYYDRPALFAEALHVNTSYLTAVANDYSFNDVYARSVQSKGRKGDVLVAISTSGNSENIIRAMVEAHRRGMITVGLTGNGGGKMAAHSDYLLNVPSASTPRIQEAHILIGHILCELVEASIFPQD